jgi:hypothetical protein
LKDYPILARTNDAMATAKILGERVPMVAFVEGGLHALGEQRLYFTITMTAHRAGMPNQCYRGGAAHDTIQELFGDRFDDLIAMHLSDEDGVPTHGTANGAYWLRGYFGGLGATYHGGTNQMHFPLAESDRDPAKPWQTTAYRNPTRLECLDIFAKMWRIDRAEASEIARDCYGRGLARFDERLADHCAAMKGRWKEQAESVKARYGLQVFHTR